MNHKLNHLIACLKHPLKSVKYFLERGGRYRMNDREYLEFAYDYLRGEHINLDNPVTYTEKLNWMKIYDHNPLYTRLVDKYSVKKYVEDKIGKEYVVPLIGVWDNVEEIDFQTLPEKFVLKCTHDSGGVFICEDREKFNFNEVKEKISARLKKDYSKSGREWAYGNVPRKIIAEKYVENLSDNNYKFFCFNGKCKVLYVAPFREKFVDYFDRDFNHLDIFTEIHGMDKQAPSKPTCFEKMRGLAETLAEGLRAVRVDLYLSNEKIYFGEFTFFHEGGFMPFQPDHWNYDFGSWLKID